MDRITEDKLQKLVTYINHTCGHDYMVLDHHQPGGNSRVWAIENKNGSRPWYSSRMSGREAYTFLQGVVAGLEARRAAGHE